MEKKWNYTQNEWRRGETTLETSGEEVKLHSKRVEKRWNYTRNEWGGCNLSYFFRLSSSESTSYACAISLNFSVASTDNYTRNEWGTCKLHSNWVEKIRITLFSGFLSGCHWMASFRYAFWKTIFSTRFECIFTSSPLVSSVFLHLPHSFRV